jgi:hypothetical protein
VDSDFFVAWYNFGRKHEALKGQRASDGLGANGARMDDQRTDRTIWKRIAFGCALPIGGLFVFLLGWLIGVENAYINRYWEERDYIEGRIRDNPAFSRVGYLRRSDGGTQVVGEVASKDDLQLLRSELIKAVGEERARIAILGVGVREKNNPNPTH